MRRPIYVIASDPQERAHLRQLMEDHALDAIEVAHPSELLKHLSGKTTSLIGSELKLEELERLHVERVLKRVKGNKQRAARELGIDRGTLYNKLERYRMTDIEE